MILKFLRGDESIYDLLESSALEARNCAVLLLDMTSKLTTENQDTAPLLEGIMAARRKHKKLTQEIVEKLCRTFITPLDREDIEALSTALHKIPKTVEKIAERLEFCPAKFTNEFVTRQVCLLDQGTGEVVEMVKGLRRKMSLEEAQDRQDRLQHIEGDGDKTLMDLLRELYAKKDGAIEIIILKDLYELLEKAIDRCRDCGNVVFQVILKYS